MLVVSLALLALPPYFQSDAPSPQVAGAQRPRLDSFVTPLTDAQRDEARRLIEQMTQNPRGPYAGISWFCNDGTEQLPRLNGCKEHGGGKMYGVFGPDAKKLMKMGLFVGTILTPLDPQELIDSGYYRARALAVEKYLERAKDGWVLKSAKSYRGFKQDEDESEAARVLLIRLAKEPAFLAQHRALLIRLSKALPYGRGEESLAADIRAQAELLGDADKAFQNIRFKIHSLPEPSDMELVQAYAQSAQGERKAQAETLLAAMQRYYDPVTRLARLRAVKQWVHDKTTKEAIQAFVDTDPKDTDALLVRGMTLLQVADKAVRPQSPVPERNLLLLHTMGLVEELWLALAADLAKRPVSRARLINDVGMFVDAARITGYLTAREALALHQSLGKMTSGDGKTYAKHADRLVRALEWSRARLVTSLGLPLLRYQSVEPDAARIIDDALRSGVMLPLATLLDRLAADAQRQRGTGHRLLGVSAQPSSLRGENAGAAVGTLRVVRDESGLHTLKRNDIALLYELPPELPPVAGVLTVGAVGSLSHVALLARNLGIPLASVGGDVAQALAPLEGQELVLGVSQERRVVLSTLTGLSRAELATFRGEAHKQAEVGALRIDAQALDLTTTRILSLSEVSETDAGVRLGPKAAELGRLKRLFPARVSDAAVIPFGAFARHVTTPWPDGSPAPFPRLVAAYKAFAAQGQTPEAEAALLRELATFRDAVVSKPFAPGFEAEVLAALKKLGDPKKTGVFVRSDTNVEDLKDFTGAGLNLTVPNRVGPASVLSAIREVWASPFTERSFRWRQRLLQNPEHVYPSVLLHKTVPVEVSGVLVTTDIEDGGPGLTVSVSEGVAAVVDGGSPETLVLESDGSLRWLGSNRSVTRKVIPTPPRENVTVEPAPGKDPLLTDKDLAEVRALAAEVIAKLPPKPDLPWDIEFGLLRGKGYLMQIRPLKLNRAAAVHPYLAELDAAAQQNSVATVDLEQRVP